MTSTDYKQSFGYNGRRSLMALAVRRPPACLRGRVVATRERPPRGSAPLARSRRAVRHRRRRSGDDRIEARRSRLAERARARSERIDITGAPAGAEPIARFLHEEAITVEQIREAGIAALSAGEAQPSGSSGRR
jgi:hypothetical protein